MNRCFVCGRKLKNSETTCGIEFCKVCEKYEQQLEDKGKEIGNLVRRLLATTYKDEELAIYKRALDIACENIRDMYCSDYCTHTKDERCQKICYYEQYYNKEKFLDQAKEELGKEKNK